MPLLRAIGLMSGTSMDGIDVAWLETDGEAIATQGPAGFYPYAPEDQAVLRAALIAARDLTDRDARPGVLAQADALVVDRHAQAVEAFLKSNGIAKADIDIVGFHGQTVLHRPERRLTVQIGDGAALAARLRLRVAWDMRAADVAAGGQGAPLVPAWHRALAQSGAAAGGVELPAVLLNLGGVGNITYVPVAGDPIAFDTGPANALLDDLMHTRTGAAMDAGGATAAGGKVDAAALAALMAHPYFTAPAPKSLDRNAFSAAPVERLSLEDAAATLTAFTACSVAKALMLLPSKPKLVVACGGGAMNPTLMRHLADALPCPVRAASDLGWNGDAMEAQAFAYLAVRAVRGLPLTFPTTTGVAAPQRGGIVTLPPKAL